MENEITDKKKVEKTEVKELTFLQKVGVMGYGVADQVGKMEVITRPEKDIVSYGFMDLNGRKQIVLSAKREDWKLWFSDAIKQLDKN